MINRICLYLTKSLNLNDTQRAVVKYGLEVFTSTLFSFLLTMAISLLLNIWVNTIIILTAFAIVKTSAGGAHNKTMVNCALFSSFMFTFLSLFMNYYYNSLIHYVNLVVFGTILIVFPIYYCWSPAQVPEKPISALYAQKLRGISFITLIAIFLALFVLLFLKPKYYELIIIGSCLGLLWHSFTITPLGFRLFHSVDYILARMFKGGGINEKN